MVARLHHYRFASIFLLVCMVVVAAFAFALIVPLVWNDKLYIDGLKIVHTQPSFEIFGSSFTSAALFLKPWLTLADAIGGSTSDYGSHYGYGLIATNAVFGITVLSVFSWFSFKYVPYATWGNAINLLAVMVLLAPFYFCITKELIFFLASVAPLAVISRGQRRVGFALLLYFASLVFLGLYYRTYYLLYALVLYANLICFKRWSWVLLLYGTAFLLVFVTFRRLPWDLLLKGRAEYLADVSSSRIEYFFPDSSYIGFIANRSLTFMLMMFPVNLIIRSPAYIPFAVLQIWVGLKVVLNLKSRVGGIVGFATQAIFSFTIVQALFEPDYGSYFRHRVGLILFMLIILCRFVRIPNVSPELEGGGASSSVRREQISQ